MLTDFQIAVGVEKEVGRLQVTEISKIRSIVQQCSSNTSVGLRGL